ncbi:hypothetical protein JVX93_15820 [Mycolicibacterium boenickei]|nr:hypothetical protein JVX93_15820 [Mycolicibacterium boenickei]
MPTGRTLTAKQQYDRDRYRRLRAERIAAAPPDPISELGEPEIAYLAGLTDADGSIYVTHTNRLKTYYPTVCWAMTHEATIRWVSETLGGTAVQLHNHTNLRRGATSWGTSNFRPQFKTSVTGARAQLLCTRMEPWMKTKAAQAALVVAFPVDARSAPGVRLPEEIRLQRISIAEQLTALNRPWHFDA